MAEIIRFATPEMFIDRMPASKSIDHEIIKATMYNEQDTTIHNLLGTSLYENIKSEIDNDSLAGKRLELIEKHVRSALFHLTFKALAIHLNLRMTDKGILKQSDQNAAQGDSSDSYKLQSYHQNKAEFHMELARKFICENPGSFNDYDDFPDDGGVSPGSGYFSGFQLD